MSLMSGEPGVLRDRHSGPSLHRLQESCKLAPTTVSVRPRDRSRLCCPRFTGPWRVRHGDPRREPAHGPLVSLSQCWSLQEELASIETFPYSFRNLPTHIRAPRACRAACRPGALGHTPGATAAGPWAAGPEAQRCLPSLSPGGQHGAQGWVAGPAQL